jgi:K+-sensing histidine kinase KdpD
MRSMPPFGEASRRLQELEELLRALHRAASAYEAAALVEQRLPALVDADEAALFLLDVDRTLLYEPGGERWLSLAESSIARRQRMPGRALTETEGGAAVAAAIGGPAGPIGAVVVACARQRRFTGEDRRFVQLFAEHAATALSRFAAPASV